MRCFLRRLLECLGLATLSLPVCAAPSVVDETALKTAFIYNFVLFAEWPALPARDDVLVLCTVGETALAQALRSLQDKPVNQRRIAVVDERGSPSRCDIRVSTRPLPATESRVADAGTAASAMAFLPPPLSPSGLAAVPVTGMLIVVENGVLGEGDTMIGLAVEDGRVRFDIDTAAAGQAGIRISSKLLRLARYVR